MGRKRGNRGGSFHHNMAGYSGHSSTPQRPQTNTTYRLHEKLTPESREREYKEAQGQFMKQQLFQTVARYVCGFLNSQVEGKLILGVTDKCEVIGVNNSYEDSDRRTIDAAINGLKPNVFPQDYQLSYCDILDSVGNKISHLSVVELTVYRKDNLTTLYETNKRECCQRRDASSEEMSPQQIQDWWRQRTNHATNQDKKEIENLGSNLRGKESQLRDKENVLRDQEAKLRDLQSQVQRTENDASNIQSKCERMEGELERLREENKELKEQKQEKDTKKSESKCVRTEGEIERCRELKEQVQEKDTEKSEAVSSTVQRELQDIKNMLARKNQSRVCTIS